MGFQTSRGCQSLLGLLLAVGFKQVCGFLKMLEDLGCLLPEVR